MIIDSRPDPAKRLQQARLARGFSDAKSAAAYFGWSYNSYAQHENGTRGLGRAADQYAKAFRVSKAWLLTGETSGQQLEVPVKGKVGAGAIVEAIDNGDVEHVPAPVNVAPDTVAVRVAGDSMHPAYEEGSLIFYSRRLPAQDLINRRAVVQLSDGRIFIKVLRQGSEPDLWTLQSLNPLYSDIEDQEVEWAAPIDWIKPPMIDR